VLSRQESFEPAICEQSRMGVPPPPPDTSGHAHGARMAVAAELREGTVIRLLTAVERTVPILAVRSASRRLSAKVRIHRAIGGENFALCYQFIIAAQLRGGRMSVASSVTLSRP